MIPNSRAVLAVLITLMALASAMLAADEVKPSFTGKVTRCEMSRMLPADAIFTQADCRFLLHVEVTDSAAPGLKVGEVLKVAIHSPAMTFHSGEAVGSMVRCVVTDTATDQKHARGNLSVISEHKASK